MPDNTATVSAQSAIAASVSALLPGPEWLRPLTEKPPHVQWRVVALPGAADAT